MASIKIAAEVSALNVRPQFFMGKVISSFQHKGKEGASLPPSLPSGTGLGLSASPPAGAFPRSASPSLPGAPATSLASETAEFPENC